MVRGEGECEVGNNGLLRRRGSTREDLADLGEIKGTTSGAVWTNFNLMASLVVYIWVSSIHRRKEKWNGVSSAALEVGTRPLEFGDSELHFGVH